MKINAISVVDNVKEKLVESQRDGFITFLYHDADPQHTLLSNKFLYIHSVDELNEKIALLESDITIRDTLHL